MVLLKRKDMKKLIYTSVLALLLAGAGAIRAQDRPEEYLGLPGDNLNLYAVMDLFQKSETLEGFERSLNDENSRINNLDLNGDNLVDYLMVSDYVEGNVHSIVLRVALNQDEYQDVAVFTVEKFADGSVQIQLIGDEALYGKNYIIEPNYAETPNPGYRGNGYSAHRVEVITTTYWDIARWPVVVYIYRPGYNAWRSAWYWGYWPNYWYAWTPFYWDYYYGYHYNWYPHYYAHYRHWDHYRCHWYNDYYYNRVRIYSPTVVVNIHKNYYRSTYSRPDLRKEGEALYTRERGSRTNGMETNVSRDDRRSVNQPTGNEGRLNNGSGTSERRTTGTVNNGSRTYSSSGRSDGSAGRSGTSVNKSTGNSSGGRSTGTSSRQTTTVNRSTGNNTSGRTYGSSGRTTGSSTYKSSNTSSSGRSSGSVSRSGSSGSYRSSGSSSSGRSSGSVSRSGSSGSYRSSGSSSSGRSSGSVSRSGSSGSHKSSGSSSSGRTSGSGGKSASGKGSTSSSRSRR